MTALPNSLEDAIVQAKGATQAAIGQGFSRLTVELVFPELKIMPLAQQFYPLFQEMGLQFKVYFPDAGAAALAKRDWDNPDVSIRGLGELKGQIEPDDDAFLIIEPSAVEVEAVEKLVEASMGRPVVILNPKLEDIATIGIGYAGRQLRERFLNTLEACYYLRPMEGAAIRRCYPSAWQVWREIAAGDYELLTETPTRPQGEALDRILYSNSEDETLEAAPTKPKKGFLGELQQFIRALTQ
ncbi:MAG: DUF1995 family protein [Cyanobacteria bacterium J06635_15]